MLFLKAKPFISAPGPCRISHHLAIIWSITHCYSTQWYEEVETRVLWGVLFRKEYSEWSWTGDMKSLYKTTWTGWWKSLIATRSGLYWRPRTLVSPQRPPCGSWAGVVLHRYGIGCSFSLMQSQCLGKKKKKKKEINVFVCVSSARQEIHEKKKQMN